MPAGLQSVITDFTFHPYGADVTFEHLTDFSGELSDG
jgi:hypothetical protein